MCIQIPFKEHCISFWSLDNTLKNEVEEKASIVIEKGKVNFSSKEKCFKYTGFNNVLKIKPKNLKNQNISLIFQTLGLELENDDLPNCSLFSIVKDGQIKVCLDFKQYDDYFCINTIKQPMGKRISTTVPIKTLTQDRWVTHAIIYEHDKKQIKYYINATLACVMNSVIDIKQSDLYFNREYSCNGYIRNIGAYNCALTYDQIKKLSYHNYYKKITHTMWLKFIEFIYKDKKEMIPWI